MQSLVLGLMGDWNGILFTLEESEKTADVRQYVTNIYNIIVSIVIGSITRILALKSFRI